MRKPVSVPLRAMAVTTELNGTPWAASMMALHETMEKFKKNCEVLATKSSVWWIWSCGTRPCAAARGTARVMKNSEVDAALRLCTSSPMSSACD